MFDSRVGYDIQLQQTTRKKGYFVARKQLGAYFTISLLLSWKHSPFTFVKRTPRGRIAGYVKLTS